MSDICRLCGDLKPLERLSCLKMCMFQLIRLNISLEFDKMLPSSVCGNCCQNVSFCCEFVDQVSNVQLRLKADLAEQLQMVTFDPFIADRESKEVDVKIEGMYPDSELFVNFHPGGSQSSPTDPVEVNVHHISTKQRRVPVEKNTKTVSHRMFKSRQRGKLELLSLILQSEIFIF